MFLKLLFSNIKMLVRNKQALFWSLAFPLMFTVIFGFFFGKGSSATGTIDIVNDSKTEIANNLESFLVESDQINVVVSESLDDSKTKLDKNDVSSVIYVPKSFGEIGPQGVTGKKEVEIFQSPANAQVNGIVVSFVNNYLTQANYNIQNAKPVFTVKTTETANTDFNYFDFVVVGLIGMALMNGSIQGVAIPMAKYREDKILKRITTTPLKTPIFILAEVASRLFQNALQVTLILGVSIYFFDAHVINIPIIYALALLGAVLFQSIGFAVAGISKTTDAAQGASMAITIPMMFLAGVFFPIDQLPAWLSPIVQILPLAPLLEMIRQIGLDDISPFTNISNILIVGGWIIAMLIASSYCFRLSEE